MKKYRYFIPGIGFILFLITLFCKYEGSDFDLYYGEDLGLAFIGACLLLHIPTLVGLGFLLIL